MNTALRCSATLNILLGGSLVWIVANHATNTRTPETPVDPLSVAQPHANPGSAMKQDAHTFHWSQIETTDYPTYISNLRAIGCPETTIRDIIVADVVASSSSNRARLEQELTRLASVDDPTTTDRRRAILLTLNQARREESLLVNQLLGTAAIGEDHEEPVLGPTNLRADRAAQPSTAVVALPLVFQGVDPNSLGLEPAHLEAIDRLRHAFVDEMGSTGLDRRTPEYLDRWNRAQPANDALLRGMIGINAWQNYQLTAESHK